MKIKRGSTGVLFEGYHPKDCHILEYNTSILNRNTHKIVETTGFYDSDTTTFATYWMNNDTLKYMTTGSKFNNIEVENIKNTTAIPMQSFNSNISLTEIQLPVINKMTYITNSEMFVNLPTAVGKTVVAVHYLTYYNKKTVISCYRKKVLDQWYKTLTTKTDIDASRIKIISSSTYLLNVLNDSVSTDTTDIWLVTPALISSFCNSYGWDKLSQIFDKMGIGLKIIDEAHRNLGTTIKINAWTSVDKTIYLSADFNQASYEVRNQFFKVFSTVPVIKLDNDVMKDLKHITAITYIFDSHPSTEDIIRITNGMKRNKYHWDHFAYTKYAKSVGCLSQIVQKIIRQIIQSEENISYEGKPYKILVLTNMIDTVDDMYSVITSMNTGRTVGRYHGKLSKDEMELAPECDIIVSTYQAFSTGVDVTLPNFRHVISMNPVDSITANQAAGRNRPIPGLTSYFWMLVDAGFEFHVKNASKVVKYLSDSRIGLVKRIDDR